MKIAVVVFILCYASFANAQNTEKEIPFGNNPQAGKYANVNGIRMYYEIYGQGKPLLLIHGNGGSVYSGRNQISFFSKFYKVIAVESRGQGKTTDNSDSLTYELMADDINALLEYLHIDSTYIIGQSDGAILGLILAIKYPKKVKMLAAMAPNIRPDSGALYPITLNRMFNDFARLSDSVNKGYKEKIPSLKLVRLMIYHPHISNESLGTIAAPVLLMSGDRDMITLSHIQEMFRTLPKAQLCVFPGSTHFALRQNSLVFNETIQRFFSQPFQMPSSF